MEISTVDNSIAFFSSSVQDSQVEAFVNRSDNEKSQIAPILSLRSTSILAIVFSTAFCVCTGIVGIFTNTANITVYLRMRLTETTTISFFALSVTDLLVSMGTAWMLICYNRLVSGLRLPSGAPVSEIGIGASFILYPCLGCSA